MALNIAPVHSRIGFRLEDSTAPTRGMAMERSFSTYPDGGKKCATANSPDHIGAYDPTTSLADLPASLSLVAGQPFCPVVGGRFYAHLSATVAAGDKLVTSNDGGYKNDSGVTSPNVVGTATEAGDSGDVIIAEYGSQSDQHD